MPTIRNTRPPCSFVLKKSVLVMTGVLLTSLGSFSVQAQDRSEGLRLEEIVVTARRRDESVQEVPITVNTVTGKMLEDLNIRSFADISGIIPGLTVREDQIAPNVSLRGVHFDVFASGNNGTVEFYLNDSPITSTAIVQSMFDVGQIEVLRGPQGTLRGRASPSGSITVTTQRPVLDDFEGYVDATASDIGSTNFRGAINLPIVEDMVAVRLAGVWEENERDQVKTLSPLGGSAESETKGYRASVRFTPTETLSIDAMYQRLEREDQRYAMVESANIANPNLPAADIPLSAGDRRSVVDFPSRSDNTIDRYNLEVEWEVANQLVKYAGSQTRLATNRADTSDVGDFFRVADGYSDTVLDSGQELESRSKSKSHEIRLQSAEPLFDRMDYVIGYLHKTDNPGSDVLNKTLIFFGPASPSTFLTAVNTVIFSGGKSTEQSVFGNLTFHLSDNTELSGGLRHIEFENSRLLTIGGATRLDQEEEFDETIYSLSLKHNFADNVMAYFAYGGSWRPGISAVGNFSVNQSAREIEFTNLPPETSDSFEVGVKTDWLDGRLRLNATVFHQEFKNYPYRAPGDIFFVNYNQGANGLIPNVGTFNFVAPVPVDVNGIELETSFQATDQWSLAGLFSWAKGEIQAGTIPCNDYFPTDGIPDGSTATPTVDQILNANNGEHLAACEVDYRASQAPLWSASLNSEYTFPLAGRDAYVRGQWSLYGKSKNDPSNSVDDIDSYNILNLYAGLRDPQGKWEVMLFAKNVTDTEEVLSRAANPVDAEYRQLATAVNVDTAYREITLTAPREFGINVKYRF